MMEPLLGNQSSNKRRDRNVGGHHGNDDHRSTTNTCRRSLVVIVLLLVYLCVQGPIAVAIRGGGGSSERLLFTPNGGGGDCDLPAAESENQYESRRINKFQQDVEDIGNELAVIKKTLQQLQMEAAAGSPTAATTSSPPLLPAPMSKTTKATQKISFRTNRGGTLVLDTIQENQNYTIKGIENFTADHPYIAETLYHYGSFPIDKILKGGKAKPYYPIINTRTNETSTQLVWPAHNESEAVCTIRHIGFIKGDPYGDPTLDDQIPHHMQQLLRCFSWWQLNKHQRPVLHTEVDYSDPKEKVYSRPYILSIHKALKEVFNVRIDYIQKKSNAPNVTVDVPWRYFRSLINTYVLNSKDARTITDGFLKHFFPNDSRRAGCPADYPSGKSNTTNITKGKRPKPTILLLNREGARRALGNHKEIYTSLKLAGYNIFYLQSFNELTLLEQVQVMSRVDILMGPHGAQFTNTLFQPECGSLLEFFGDNYYVPNFFGSLARLSGKHHFFTFNGGYTDQEHYHRNNPSFKVDPEVVVQMTHIAVDRWHQCCKVGGFARSHILQKANAKGSTLNMDAWISDLLNTKLATLANDLVLTKTTK